VIVFASCVADDEKFRRFAAPGLGLAMEDDSAFVRVSHPTSIFVAYNGVLDALAGRDDVEAVVLLHEDTEVRDPAFAAKVRAALADPSVAVAGVVGARGIAGLAWWEGTCFGRVDESRGLIDHGGGVHDVDVVDGLLLVLSPWAVRTLRFDDRTFTGFHAYDADLCLQARAAGRRVVVLDTDVCHHTKGGYGDVEAYRAADAAFRAKWGGAPAASPAPASSTSTSIVIPLFNRVELTMSCIQALLEHTPEADVELVLVDNGSTDATAQLLDGLAGDDVTLVRNATNLGFARACNQGAAAASGERLLFLNNDVVVRPGWLAPLQHALDADPTVAAASPLLLFPDGLIQHGGVYLFDVPHLPAQEGQIVFGPSLRHYRQPGDLPAAHVAGPVPALTAASMLVRRDAFEQAGGFDEGYWNGYEDIDLCLRLRRLGWGLRYEPASVAVHHESASGPERFSREAANVQRFAERWRGRVVPDVVVLPDGRSVAVGLASEPESLPTEAAREVAARAAYEGFLAGVRAAGAAGATGAAA
jgi:GT2 family glycosyltransferase